MVTPETRLTLDPVSVLNPFHSKVGPLVSPIRPFPNNPPGVPSGKTGIDAETKSRPGRPGTQLPYPGGREGRNLRPRWTPDPPPRRTPTTKGEPSGEIDRTLPLSDPSLTCVEVPLPLLGPGTPWGRDTPNPSGSVPSPRGNRRRKYPSSPGPPWSVRRYFSVYLPSLLRGRIPTSGTHPPLICRLSVYVSKSNLFSPLSISLISRSETDRR